MTQRYDTYKDSGVQWLGEIPGHWENKRLAALFTDDIEINKDFQYKRAFKYNYGCLVPKNEIGEPEEYRDVYVKYSIVNTGDILINGLNLNYDFITQRVACAPSGGIITSAYVVCRPRPNVNYNYYTYLFKAMDSMKMFHGMGTGIRLTLSFKELKKQLLPIPPLSEQRSIVSFLDAKCGKIDEWVTKKQKEVEHLQELKQRVIADAVTRGLNPHVKMKATNIPWLKEIPEHWENKRLAALFTGDIDSNKDFRFKHAFKFNYGSLVLKDEIGAPEEYRTVYVKYSIVNKGDILVNGLNLNYDFISQRVACAPSDGIITSAYVVCRPRPNVNYVYYTYLFKAMDSMKLFHGMGTGIRLTLSFKELKKQMLPVPPLSEQKQIVSYLDTKTSQIDKLIAHITKEIECIKEYKQRLISDVVTGQIKVC